MMPEPGKTETQVEKVEIKIKKPESPLAPESPISKEVSESETLGQLEQELGTAKLPEKAKQVQILPTIARYDQKYAEIAESRYGKGPLAKHGEVIIKAAEASFSENAVVLEIGCNTGMFMQQLTDSSLGSKIQKLSGVDVNKDAIDIAMQKGLDASLGDAQNLEGIPDSSVNIIFSMHTYEHVADLHKAFQEISRVLTLGGKAYLILPPNVYGLETIRVAAEDLPEDEKGKGLFGGIKTFINAWKYARKLHCSNLGGPFGGARKHAEKILKESGTTNLKVSGGMGINRELAFANLLVFEKLLSL